MKEKYKYLSKNIFLFALSSFVPKLLTFLLIPIYTSYLTTKEYGISDLINTTTSLLLPIFSLVIHDAVLRFSMDKDYDNKDVFSTALKINIVGFIIIIVILSLLSIMNFFDLKINYILFMIIIYISNALNSTFNMFCRGINKVKTITISSIINTVITLFCNILFLTVFNWGINGYLLANSIGYIISLLFIFFHAKLYKYITIRTSKKTRQKMLKYSFPLIFNVISWWINESSDRYFLTWLIGIEESGLYSISYKIPNILVIFQNIFFQAWSISVIKYFDKNDNDNFISKIFTAINITLVFSCSLLMIANIPIAKILYSKDFFQAWKYVPPLLISVVFNALSLLTGGIFTAVKDTKTISVSTIIGAIINIILNYVLINKFNTYGAAVATLISYFVVLIIRQILSRKHIKLKINLFKNYLSYILLIIQMLFAISGLKYIYVETIILMIIFIIYFKEILNFYRFVKNKLVKDGKNE